MNISNRIKDILHEQIRAYRILLDVLQRERAYLVQLNPEGVETLSKEKDTIILKLRLLEEERIRLIRAFACETGAPGDLTLQKLQEVTGDDAYAQLRSQMLSLIQAIAEFNEFNKILIEKSAAFVRRTLGFLGTLGASQGKAGGAFSMEA
ncbi:MAG: flagellar protein FlgN [Nitrospirota bacterium]